MERFLFDYLYDREQKVVINELIAAGLDGAIEFVDEHFMELHALGETEISAIRLRTEHDETLLIYELHSDVAAGNS